MSERMETLFDDGRCRLKVQFYRGHAYVHLKVMRWSASVLKMMRARWPDIFRTLKVVGCKRVLAYYRESNAIMQRFAAKFGFNEIQRNNGWVLMEVKNA